MKKVMTLCIVSADNKILLGMKKRGFGVGRWNGFGGKIESGENILEAAKRELTEEAGIVASELEKVGLMTFTFENEQENIIEVHVFKVNSFSGEPTESEEMEPDWFSYSEIPYNQMWTDDEYWLPLVLTGKHFTASFHLDRPADADCGGNILRHDIDVVDELTSEPGLSK